MPGLVYSYDECAAGVDREQVRVHRNSLYYLCHFAKVSMYPHSERKLIHGVIVTLIHGAIVSQVCSHSNLSCSTPFCLG